MHVELLAIVIDRCVQQVNVFFMTLWPFDNSCLICKLLPVTAAGCMICRILHAVRVFGHLYADCASASNVWLLNIVFAFHYWDRMHHIGQSVVRGFEIIVDIQTAN
jgi:hypothetical protein